MSSSNGNTSAHDNAGHARHPPQEPNPVSVMTDTRDTRDRSPEAFSPVGSPASVDHHHEVRFANTEHHGNDEAAEPAAAAAAAAAKTDAGPEEGEEGEPGTAVDNDDNNSDEFDHAAAKKYSNSFLKKNYVSKLPEHLVPLANEIHKLGEADLVLIADIADTEATTDVYSLLPYTGSNWFLPSIRECKDGERHWGFGYSWHDGLLIFIGGRRMNIRVLNIIVRIAFLVLCWFMMWNILPRWLVEPGGYVWDPCVLIVVSAVVGGLVCRILQIPPLVGVLWMGIMWNNIPTLHYLTSGIVKNVFDISSKLGLTVILARAGYSLSIKGILPHWKQSAMLATLPFAIEGVAHSLIANKIFHYNDDYNWAFLQGMLCSIVSPAVVVPGTLYLQEMGYGKGVGPLSLMLSAVGVEIVIGVWCANFIIGLIFYDQKLAVAIVLGPVQFVGGIIIGVGIGFIYFYVVELIKKEARRLPNGKYEREHFRTSLDFAFAIFLFACFTMVFLGYGVNLAGGGCVMCVFFAATVSHLWLKDGKKELEDQKKYVGSWLAWTWDQVMMPVLFATMGAKIDVLAIFNADFFPKAIICLVCSTAVRLVVIFCVQLGDGMSWKEKVLVCIGYLGKASAQASVGPIAANLVADMVSRLPEDEKGSLDTWVRYANNVQQMSAMYVMFMAAVASLGMVRGGMVILKREKQPAKGPRSPRGSLQGETAANATAADGNHHNDRGSAGGGDSREDAEEMLGRRPQWRAAAAAGAADDEDDLFYYNCDVEKSKEVTAKVASSYFDVSGGGGGGRRRDGSGGDEVPVLQSSRQGKRDGHHHHHHPSHPHQRRFHPLPHSTDRDTIGSKNDDDDAAADAGVSSPLTPGVAPATKTFKK